MIELSRQQKEAIAQKVQRYLEDELDIEIGQFDSEFLIDFMTQQLGPVYYNQGISDAKTLLDRRLYELSDELYEIELPVDL